MYVKTINKSSSKVEILPLLRCYDNVKSYPRRSEDKYVVPKGFKVYQYDAGHYRPTALFVAEERTDFVCTRKHEYICYCKNRIPEGVLTGVEAGKIALGGKTGSIDLEILSWQTHVKIADLVAAAHELGLYVHHEGGGQFGWYAADPDWVFEYYDNGGIWFYDVEPDSDLEICEA